MTNDAQDAEALALLVALKKIVFDWDGEPEDMDEAREAIAAYERARAPSGVEDHWLNCSKCGARTYVKRWQLSAVSGKVEAWTFCASCKWHGFRSPAAAPSAPLASTVAAPGVDEARDIIRELLTVKHVGDYSAVKAAIARGEAFLAAPTPVAASGPLLGSEAWQSIEAAPRDGTRILATGGGLGEEVDAVKYDVQAGCWLSADYTLDDRDDEPDGYNRPTLWRSLPAPTSAGPSLVAAETEACARAVEEKAVLLDRKECCGIGQGSPPECCAEPLYMIASVDAAAVIRARIPSDALARMEAERAIVEAARAAAGPDGLGDDVGNHVVAYRDNGELADALEHLRRLTQQGEAKTGEGK